MVFTSVFFQDKASAKPNFFHRLGGPFSALHLSLCHHCRKIQSPKFSVTSTPPTTFGGCLFYIYVH